MILGPDITTKIDGVALCDNDGEAIVMDGTVKLIDGHVAWVVIKRVSERQKPGRGEFRSREMRWVERKEIYKVSEKPANAWGDGREAIATALERAGKRHGELLAKSFHESWAWATR